MLSLQLDIHSFYDIPTLYSSCYSSVGRDYKKSGMQSMSLGPECLQTSIVLHELLHSLGFWHEQSRPDRDQYVEIFWENIKQG